jgi:hypothetical protein
MGDGMPREDRPALEELEIEVTSEMIEAGVDELKGNYLDLISDPDTFAEITAAVYRAMAQAARKPS